MSIIKSFSVGNGDMYYINHNSDNFTVIDCNLSEDSMDVILTEIQTLWKSKGICRFISTHPDNDHISGLKEFDELMKIVNFYCVDNNAKKEDETDDFLRYCELRDGSRAFHIYKGCSRKWMNMEDSERRTSGIHILWPILTNEDYKKELKKASEKGSPNNISPIIKYSVENGVTALWFGDLETTFMEDIVAEVDMPKADVVFAPHHGRDSGKIPKKWLDVIDPKIIIIGEAPSSNLNYYQGYNTITQNSAGDIVFDCGNDVDIYVSKESYSVDYLIDNKKSSTAIYGYYIGTLEL